MAAQNHKCKIALITGAKKGIGYELARQVGKEGLTVLMAARNAALGDAAAGKLKADGAKAYFIELDVTKPETIARAAKTILVGHIFLAHLLTFLCGERYLPPRTPESFCFPVVRLRPAVFVVTNSHAMLSRSRNASGWIRDNARARTEPGSADL